MKRVQTCQDLPISHHTQLKRLTFSLYHYRINQQDMLSGPGKDHRGLTSFWLLLNVL